MMQVEHKTLLNKLSDTQRYADMHFPKQFIITMKETKNLSTLDFTEFANVIISHLCDYLQIDIDSFKSKNRLRSLVDARCIFIYYMTDTYSGFSSTSLGAVINRDHATVFHYLKKHRALYKSDKNYTISYENIEYYLNESLHN